MKNLKKALDWDQFEEPRRTEVYRWLNAASWLAACEYGEAVNSVMDFIIGFLDKHPEWTPEFVDVVKPFKELADKRR